MVKIDKVGRRFLRRNNVVRINPVRHAVWKQKTFDPARVCKRATDALQPVTVGSKGTITGVQDPLFATTTAPRPSQNRKLHQSAHQYNYNAGGDQHCKHNGLCCKLPCTYFLGVQFILHTRAGNQPPPVTKIPSDLALIDLAPQGAATDGGGHSCALNPASPMAKVGAYFVFREKYGHALYGVKRFSMSEAKS